tara:strand:- start:1395 stop:1610 length:216 start_codon:yes stop_codon:yes gene_type:complete
MGGKTSRIDANKDHYSSEVLVEEKFGAKARLDLNDLLKRMKDQKKHDKKLNLLIISGAASVAAVVILILNL